MLMSFEDIVFLTITFCYAKIIKLNNIYRGVAQLVARSVRDAEVVGSIPVASTKNSG